MIVVDAAPVPVESIAVEDSPKAAAKPEVTDVSGRPLFGGLRALKKQAGEHFFSPLLIQSDACLVLIGCALFSLIKTSILFLELGDEISRAVGPNDFQLEPQMVSAPAVPFDMGQFLALTFFFF